jgi:hypothetical protein
MLLYLPVEGHFLDEILSGDQALPWLALVGVWLGTLHRRHLPLPRQFHLATELVNTRTWAALIRYHYPDEAEAVTQITDYLQKRADILPFKLDVPIHKDFHYGHVIVNQKLQVIDFDEMRLGDPNFDVGHFCANLSLLACRQRSALWSFAKFQSAFLDVYAGFTGWVADERLVYFYAYTCLKIAWQLCNGYGPHPRPEGKERRRQVRQMLQQGLTATLPATTAVLLGKSALLTARLDNDRSPT